MRISLLALALCGLLIFAACEPSYVYPTHETTFLPVHEHYIPENFLENQDNALRVSQGIRNLTPMDEYGNFIFPHYYGGRFIDDAGHLVVNIVRGYDPFVSPVFGYALANEQVGVRYVDFSYNDLLELMRYIQAYAKANPDCPVVVANVSRSLDIVENCMVVDFYGYSQGLKGMFRARVVDSPMVVFREVFEVPGLHLWGS